MEASRDQDADSIRTICSKQSALPLYVKLPSRDVESSGDPALPCSACYISCATMLTLSPHGDMFVSMSQPLHAQRKATLKQSADVYEHYLEVMIPDASHASQHIHAFGCAAHLDSACQ